MNLEDIKKEIVSNVGRKVEIKIYGMRNKTETIKGEIYKVYPNIFIISNSRENRSLNYADIITKEVVIRYL